MPSPRVCSRKPLGASSLRLEHDADLIGGYLEDAARYPGGHADVVAFPETEADVTVLLAQGKPLLVVGAQSSLTGGATPHGETVMATSRLTQLRDWTATSVRAGVGVVLRDLEAECARRDLYFPPVPTFDGATVGGVVSTDAAGAATFKHGTVRAWVEGLTVVLACGEVLDLVRGQVLAGADGCFEIVRTTGEVLRVPVPRVASPNVPKISAGYRGGAGMDLVDLFVGSEGTLGVVTEVTLRLASPRPAWMAVLVPVASDAEALAITRELRREALRARRGEGGADVAAIEYMDARSVEILREDGVPEREGVPLGAAAGALLLVQLELPPSYDRERAIEEMTGADGDGPVAALARLLDRCGVLHAAVPALPGEDSRRRALFALREAVPQGVNARIRAAALRSAEPVSKAGGDVIVPFEHLEEALERYRAVIEGTGLDAAIWGHISDGNLHPNLLASCGADMELARAAQVAIGAVAIELGGSPLAEHGTGRNASKKRLLESFHGTDGVESMRAVKQVLDPQWLLAPGVLFDR